MAGRYRESNDRTTRLGGYGRGNGGGGTNGSYQNCQLRWHQPVISIFIRI